MLFSTAGCAAFDNNKAACEEKVLFSSSNFFAAFFCERKTRCEAAGKKVKSGCWQKQAHVDEWGSVMFYLFKINPLFVSIDRSSVNVSSSSCTTTVVVVVVVCGTRKICSSFPPPGPQQRRTHIHLDSVA